jgi:hypothetical protein
MQCLFELYLPLFLWERSFVYYLRKIHNYLSLLQNYLTDFHIILVPKN